MSSSAGVCLGDVNNGMFPFELVHPTHTDDVPRTLSRSPAKTLELGPCLQLLEHGLADVRPILLQLVRGQH
eukprot:1119492-Lingulodinium_polyedra.AAC.1